MKRSAALLLSGLLVGGLAACGDDAENADGAATAPSAVISITADPHDEHADHADHLMNDPHATPADELDGAELREGEFQVLDTAPPGSDDVAGQVWLAENKAGTTVTVRLTGLTVGDDYMLHLHEQVCAEDNGGGHFMFDPDGEEVPPNEVHLAFTAAADGTGEATVTNDRKVGDAAKSIVMHPSAAMDNRIACADL